MTCMKYKAVIFDLDGTLTYTLEDLWASTNYALRRMQLPERTLDEVRMFVGNGVGNLIRKAMGSAATEEAFGQCLAVFREHYVRHCFDRTRLYDGVEDLLIELQRRGVRIAIASNKLQAGVDEIYRRWFTETVDIAIGEREGLRRKPAPDMVDEVIRRWGIPKDECLYVGDSDVDLATARNSGLRCVSVLWGFRGEADLLAAGATDLIKAPSELLRFFGS